MPRLKRNRLGTTFLICFFLQTQRIQGLIIPSNRRHDFSSADPSSLLIVRRHSQPTAPFSLSKRIRLQEHHPGDSNRDDNSFSSEYFDKQPEPELKFDVQAAEDDDDTTTTATAVASPLSQLPSEEDEALYRGTFSNYEEWLDEATRDMLNEENIPLGALTDDDVESIAGLMAAWVRRRSVEAALTAEKLLKRIVDDMREGNSEVHITSRHYTIVSWMID